MTIFKSLTTGATIVLTVLGAALIGAVCAAGILLAQNPARADEAARPDPNDAPETAASSSTPGDPTAVADAAASAAGPDTSGDEPGASAGNEHPEIDMASNLNRDAGHTASSGLNSKIDMHFNDSNSVFNTGQVFNAATDCDSSTIVEMRSEQASDVDYGSPRDSNASDDIDAKTADENSSKPCKYMGNKQSRKFHLWQCPYAQQMWQSRRQPLARRRDAIDDGFLACRYCLPRRSKTVRAFLLLPKPQNSDNSIIQAQRLENDGSPPSTGVKDAPLAKKAKEPKFRTSVSASAESNSNQQYQAVSKPGITKLAESVVLAPVKATRSCSPQTTPH